MDNLGIIDLYEKNTENGGIKEFAGNIDSTLIVETEKKQSNLDTEWIEMIERTIPYIDNIFRSPNRFIVNEEELVKVEQAKKITIETIFTILLRIFSINWIIPTINPIDIIRKEII